MQFCWCLSIPRTMHCAMHYCAFVCISAYHWDCAQVIKRTLELNIQSNECTPVTCSYCCPPYVKAYNWYCADMVHVLDIVQYHFSYIKHTLFLCWISNVTLFCTVFGEYWLCMPFHFMTVNSSVHWHCWLVTSGHSSNHQMFRSFGALAKHEITAEK